MEVLMKEMHALLCRGPPIKRAQVFISMLEQLLLKGSEYDMAKTRCWATPQLWLLAVDGFSLCASLWNPLNLQKVELPSLLEDLPKNCKCLLSCEPVSARCVVLIVDADEPVIWFCRVGGKEWTKHEYNIAIERPVSQFMLSKEASDEELADPRFREQVFLEYLSRGDHSRQTAIIWIDGRDAASEDSSQRFLIRSIAAVEGKFYFDISSSALGVLEFAPNPTFTTVEFEMLSVPFNSWERASPHLVESRGKLFLVAKFHNCLSQSLYKMDFSKLAWCRVYSLYDQVFCLGRFNCTASYSAWELGLTQGNVYYLREDELLTVFSPEHKYLPGSTYYPGSMVDLPTPLFGLHNVLTRGSGFIVGSL
ncbi:hypothetical protein ACP4OV_008243 [Aristida adscensionis]